MTLSNYEPSTDMHPAAVEVEQLLKQCDTRRQRRSGPGGQHRNKVESGIVLTHRPTGIRAEATERRSQHENRRVAISRLRVNLALQVRQPHDATTPISDRWKRRCHNGCVQVNSNHEHFPALLAELLDVIHAVDYDLRPGGQYLQVTSSQIVRFLKLEPRALQLVNQARHSRGMRRLR